MKKSIIAVMLFAAFGAAHATDLTAVGAKAGPVTSSQNTNVDTKSISTASNGNQSMVFAPTYNTPETQTVNNNQTIKYDGAQTINQNVNGKTENSQTIKYDGPQTINQNVTGSTSNSQTIKYDGPQNINQTVNGTTTQNQNVKQEVSGTQTQNIVQSGGTHSTVHQTFGSQTIRNTPSVSGPPLTSSNDTCMGSASGSVNAPGFGLSLGKTYVDPNCVMLKNSRELWNMGMKAAAMARMCMDEDNRKALEMTGFVCPQSGVRHERHEQIRVESARTEVVVPAPAPVSTAVKIKE